jgi:hypothetical protein
MNRLNLSPFEQAYILAAVQQHRDALTLLGLNKAEAEALAERKAALIARLEASVGDVNPGYMDKFLLQLELEQDLLDLYRRYAAERKN